MSNRRASALSAILKTIEKANKRNNSISQTCEIYVVMPKNSD